MPCNLIGGFGGVQLQYVNIDLLQVTSSFGRAMLWATRLLATGVSVTKALTAGWKIHAAISEAAKGAWNVPTRPASPGIVYSSTSWNGWSVKLKDKETSTNERLMAVPSRGFYLYFIQPFYPPYFKDEKKADDVSIHLTNPDEGFRTTLTNCAPALDSASASSGYAMAACESRNTRITRSYGVAA